MERQLDATNLKNHIKGHVNYIRTPTYTCLSFVFSIGMGVVCSSGLSMTLVYSIRGKLYMSFRILWRPLSLEIHMSLVQA
jgi:hypothetical protein